jgi:hypothetical protein
MLSPINLDHDKLFAADEVADVAADRLLSDKFISIDLRLRMRFQSFVSASVWLARS